MKKADQELGLNPRYPVWNRPGFVPLHRHHYDPESGTYGFHKADEIVFEVGPDIHEPPMKCEEGAAELRGQDQE